ncbi:Adaptive-response sensory-kinase SasA [Pseudomonas savastanoi pv. phaseolicola]|nr:Adaptive-response sensory-kinase SasA [Pseudomonas savastanoi pv. phaseolicola]
MLSVLDRGAGIDPSELDTIFNPFIRGDRARSGKGTGLGLAIVKRIAAMHGGNVELRNRSGGGLEARVAFAFRADAAEGRYLERIVKVISAVRVMEDVRQVDAFLRTCTAACLTRPLAEVLPVPLGHADPFDQRIPAPWSCAHLPQAAQTRREVSASEADTFF